jgi:hypothetical protein
MKTSFPEDPLSEFADAMRKALPDPELSSDFADSLQIRLQRPWRFREALRRDRWIQVAASLLVMTTLAGPVAALVGFLLLEKQSVPVIGFEVPHPSVKTEVMSPPQWQVIPPELTLEDGMFSLEWKAAVEVSNRMAQAISAWEKSGKTFTQPAASPARQSWQGATVKELQQEWLRRCALGLTDPPPLDLQSRVRVLEKEQGPHPQLKAWRWTLFADGSPERLFLSE